jgi:hypothetical protein
MPGLFVPLYCSLLLSEFDGIVAGKVAWRIRQEVDEFYYTTCDAIWFKRSVLIRGEPIKSPRESVNTYPLNRIQTLTLLPNLHGYDLPDGRTILVGDIGRYSVGTIILP